MSTQHGKVQSIRHKATDVFEPNIKTRMIGGKDLRERVPRSSHAKWVAPAGRPDPIDVLHQSDHGRLPELLPIRYGRMQQSPFAFFRGAAAVMAWDLSKTPVTGVRVQACGDCHVSNFGGFGSPERELLFDINDFDETLPAPWEWDVKRLAASILLASRERGIRERHCGDAVGVAVQSYREHMREYARMPVIDVWYSHLDATVLIDAARGTSAKKRWKKIEDKARLDTVEHLLPKLTELVKGRRKI